MQLILEAWKYFNLKDLIDVFIVALFVYQFIKILRGTRSMQMLLGIFLLGIVSTIGRTYQLHSINWILENLFDSFIIILVILFQEEIRSALIAMANRQTFLTKFKKFDYEDEVNEVVEGAWSLKKKNVGAIIVLENISGLNNIIQTGTELKAKVHRDLLTTIFMDKGPLHDGAVIIRRNRIVAASCFLPISSPEGMDQNLGARHRAAMGLSQMVDAVIIVVSEERGSVSVFHKGRIIPINDSFTLKRVVKYIWGTGEDLEEIFPQYNT